MVGNYILLYTSDYKKQFSLFLVIEPSAGERCFDPCVWIDTLNRLWLTWITAPSDNVYAAVCDNPDDENIIFGKERIIGKGVMMNKPTVLSTGEWFFLSQFGIKVLEAQGLFKK